MSPHPPQLRQQRQQQHQRSLATSTSLFSTLIPWTMVCFMLARSAESASPLSLKKDRKSIVGDTVKSPGSKNRQRGRHQLAHQVHHVQLVDESVHNTPVLMKKSVRKRKLQKQHQRQKQEQQQQRQHHKREHIDDAKVPRVMPRVVEAPDVTTTMESTTADSIEARDQVDTFTTTTSSTADVAHPTEQHMPPLLDSVPGIEIKTRILVNGNEKQPSPQKQVTAPKASVRKQGYPHTKMESSNRSRAKLLSAYESIVFSESQIPVFLRRQDDFRQRRFRRREGGDPETKAKSQKKNSRRPRHDDSRRKKRDGLSSGTSKNKNKNNNDIEAKVGVVATPKSSLDISGVNINAEVEVEVEDEDGLEHNSPANIFGKNSNIDSLNRNHISEISVPDPKITKYDALFNAEGQRERSGGKTMVAQGRDPVMPRKTSPRPLEQRQRHSWEQKGEGLTSGRALERHQRVLQDQDLPPSEHFKPGCDFDTAATWILLLGLVVSAIVVKNVFFLPRQRRQPNPSTNVDHPEDPAQVPLMKDHSAYFAE